MRKLETVQTKEKLNDIYVTDEIGPGGANHEYCITMNNSYNHKAMIIQMQKGPRNEKESISGIIDSDLLEIVRDRLKAFQNGPFKSEYNEKALEGVEIALKALNDRVEDRIERNVLGQNKE